MYQMNANEYSRWLTIENPAQRFWVRTWIDSLVPGTHVHWQLSPLSMLGLAHLWQYMNRQKRRFTKGQLISIKTMAERRQGDPGYIGPMPAFEEADSNFRVTKKSGIDAGAVHAAVLDSVAGWLQSRLDTV